MMVPVTPVMIAVNAIAERSHGIVDHLALREAGISQQAISLWTRTGRLHRVHEGVYSILPLGMLSLPGRWMAAVKACGPGAAAEPRDARRSSPGSFRASVALGFT